MLNYSFKYTDNNNIIRSTNTFYTLPLFSKHDNPLLCDISLSQLPPYFNFEVYFQQSRTFLKFNYPWIKFS